MSNNGGVIVGVKEQDKVTVDYRPMEDDAVVLYGIHNDLSEAVKAKDAFYCLLARLAMVGNVDHVRCDIATN